MTAGLQVFDAYGNLTLDITDRLGRMTGVVTIQPNTNGSVSIDTRQGTLWWVVAPSGSFYRPFFTDNGQGTLSWTPNPSFPTGQVPVTLLYGVR